MKTFPIHYKTNFTVCTPDDVAIKARENRCKRILRTNNATHQVTLKSARVAADKRLTLRNKIVDGVLGTMLGLVCFVGPFVIVGF